MMTTLNERMVLAVLAQTPRTFRLPQSIAVAVGYDVNRELLRLKGRGLIEALIEPDAPLAFRLHPTAVGSVTAALAGWRALHPDDIPA